jgi:hypothetical protein
MSSMPSKCRHSKPTSGCPGAKPDSTWSWLLKPVAGRQTRLIVRIRAHPANLFWTLFSWSSVTSDGETDAQGRQGQSGAVRSSGSGARHWERKELGFALRPFAAFAVSIVIDWRNLALDLVSVVVGVITTPYLIGVWLRTIGAEVMSLMGVWAGVWLGLGTGGGLLWNVAACVLGLVIASFNAWNVTFAPELLEPVRAPATPMSNLKSYAPLAPSSDGQTTRD